MSRPGLRRRSLLIVPFLLPLGGIEAMAAPKPVALNGLSDNEGCPSATTDGVVVTRQVAKGGKEVEGFEFKDKYGTGYVNVSLPEAMPQKRRAQLQRQLLALLKPGARLRVGMQGCGAAGRIQVLETVSTRP